MSTWTEEQLRVVQAQPDCLPSQVHRHGQTYVEPMTADIAAKPFSSSITERATAMTDRDSPAGHARDQQQSGAARMFGDFAPGLVGFTDDVLFGQLWTRPGLSSRDRSLVTVTALTTAGSTDQLTYHLQLARQNGLTEGELVEAITHLAFYAGWPRAISAMAVAKRVFRS